MQELIGKQVAFWCVNYIYWGRVASVSAEAVELDQAHVVYETGELTASKWADAQPLPGKWFVRLSAVESFGVVER